MKVLALPVGQLETNCYLLCDVERKLCAVIDPGADADVILENVRENGCDICAILLTHGHDDHVGGVAGIRAACPGIPINDPFFKAHQTTGTGSCCQRSVSYDTSPGCLYVF